MAVQEAEAALRHTEIVGNVQMSRGGLKLGSGKPALNKAGPKDKRKLIVEQIRKQEKTLRSAKVVAHAREREAWLYRWIVYFIELTALP